MLTMNAKQVETLIRTSPRKNGSFNLFFRLNDQIGIKLTLNEEIRDKNYKRQQKASKIGLGPEVYGKMDVGYEGEFYYGYFTEIVEVIENVASKGDNEYYKLKKQYQEELMELKEKLKDVFIFKDNHLGNIGWKNGRMVCIDFDVPSENFDIGDCYLEFDEAY